MRIRELKKYNTVKRRFYYDLGKIKTYNAFWRTKSVVLVPEEQETQFDFFFSKYHEYLVLFKGRISNLEQVF